MKTQEMIDNSIEKFLATNDSSFYKLSIFHQILSAYELTLRRASNNMRKMEIPLSSATIDLNPHQVDAALFAFKCPMSKGAILCDEVGLGKTIEAGLIISQLWAEGKHKIIILVPASIRKQWQNELLEKFNIPCIIVDGFEYKRAKNSGTINPFDRDKVIIVSIPFAYVKASEISAVSKWNLVVIDEAHHLRNVYKKSGAIRAKRLKEIFKGVPKVLLTATPLQNTLMELYGLSSFVDERLFGSEYAFKAKFMADRNGHEPKNLDILKERISTIAIRTIRRQVQEYIPYTNRISMVEDFTPTDDELRLYELVSEYLRRPYISAIQYCQRHLIILIFRKILASSSFAIAQTLDHLITNIERKMKGLEPESIEAIVSDVDSYENDIEETTTEDDDEYKKNNTKKLMHQSQQKIDIKQLQIEKEELKYMKSLAQSIHKNAKGEALLLALQHAFEYARRTGWQEKAVIFTESRRTQEYLLKLLTSSGYSDQVTIFNGSNDGPIAKRAYMIWEKERIYFKGEGSLSKDAVIREALIHEFKNHTKILIATNAGTEGINLQFCNIVINYDLPWNPQKVEQRIGRCHRYGQKNDVVVLNFLNRANAADMRVFELLDKKFRLFNGVFGASDEILGAIGSGVDFERRVLDIYQSCRTAEEINNAFDRLQEELSEQINRRMLETRAKLLEHFDDEVRARFKIISKRLKEDLSAIDLMLTKLLVSALDIKDFEIKNGICLFKITRFPEEILRYSKEKLQSGNYYIGRCDEMVAAERIHIGHPLTVAVIQSIKNNLPQTIHNIKLLYTKGKHKISLIEPFVGKWGYWAVYKLTFEGFDIEDHLIHVVFIKNEDQWLPLKQELVQKFVTISAEDSDISIDTEIPSDDIKEVALSEVLSILSKRIALKNQEYYDNEIDKFELYSEEVLMKLYNEFKEKDAELAEMKKLKQKATSFEEKKSIRDKIYKLEQACSHITDKIAKERKLLLERKGAEMKRLEKKLQLKIIKKCIAQTLWKME
jgi:SNF2 family DNA or RNA helicase